MLPDSFRFLSRDQILKLTSFYLKQALFQVDGTEETSLTCLFCFVLFFSGSYLLVVALQHQWLVELSLKFIQLNLGMAKMAR